MHMRHFRYFLKNRSSKLSHRPGNQVPAGGPKILSTVGMSLMETLIGGSLVLAGGYLLSDASTNSVKVRKTLTENMKLRKILDHVSLEVSRNSNLFVPMGLGEDEGANFYVYYSCYSQDVTLQKNEQGEVDFGIFEAGFNGDDDGDGGGGGGDDCDKDNIKSNLRNTAPLMPKCIKANSLGLSDSSPPSHPCQDDTYYIGFAYPLEDKYDVHIWSVSLERGGSIQAALSTTTTAAPL